MHSAKYTVYNKVLRCFVSFHAASASARLKAVFTYKGYITKFWPVDTMPKDLTSALCSEELAQQYADDKQSEIRAKVSSEWASDVYRAVKVDVSETDGFREFSINELNLKWRVPCQK